jgi:hypothetical protein
VNKFLLPWKFDLDAINKRIEYLKSLDVKLEISENDRVYRAVKR